MRIPFRRSANGAKRVDGVGGFLRPSRHRPRGAGADAASLRGQRRRAYLPGPPGDIHTARTATDTWPGAQRGSPAPPAQQGASGETPAGGSDSSG